MPTAIINAAGVNGTIDGATRKVTIDLDEFLYLADRADTASVVQEAQAVVANEWTPQAAITPEQRKALFGAMKDIGVNTDERNTRLCVLNDLKALTGGKVERYIDSFTTLTEAEAGAFLDVLNVLREIRGWHPTVLGG